MIANHKIKRENGVILVYTLMVMAILFSTAIGFAFFIISDIKQAKAIDDSVVAYYGAESGLERGLFLLRKKSNNVLVDNISELRSIKDSDTLSGSGAVWDIGNSTDYEPIVFRQRIYNGQSVKLFFLNRESGSNQSQSVQIEWQKGVGTTPKMQLIFTQLKPQLQDGVLIYHTDINKVEISDTLTKGGPVCQRFLDKNINGDTMVSDYVVEIKALGSGNDYMDNLIVRAYNSNDCGSFGGDSSNSEAITNITLKSIGFFNGAHREIVAQLPPRDPVSGLLSFVLFSEADITKSF